MYLGVSFAYVAVPHNPACLPYSALYNYCTDTRTSSGPYNESLGATGPGPSSLLLSALSTLTQGAPFHALFFQVVQISEVVICTRNLPSIISTILLVFSKYVLSIYICIFNQMNNTIIQPTNNLVDEALLQYYTEQWDRYTTGAIYIDRLFSYLNRHWVKREKEEGRRNVYLINTVSMLPSRPCN